MPDFCQYLKDIEVQCEPCRENGISSCHILAGTIQKEIFGTNDTIMINRDRSGTFVETDIVIRYPTKYPYARQSGKAGEFIDESLEKELVLRSFLSPKLKPLGVKFERNHEHYNPDKHDPNVVPLHIHVSKRVEDLDEAKILAAHLLEIMKPGDMEEALK